MGSIHKIKGGRWLRVQYTDAAGELRTKTLKGITDRKLAKQILAKLEEREAKIRGGILDPRDEKFVREGRAPIADHIDGWQEHLKAAKLSPKYDTHESNLVRRVMRFAGIKTLADITPGDVKRAVGRMPRQKGDGDLSARQKNKALTACKMFCEQMRRDGKLRVNPLSDVSGWDQDTDQRRQHVAYDVELARAVVQSAAESIAKVEGLTGPQRAMLYQTAAGTGFRKRTLRELRVEHLKLKAPVPYITILPSNVKNKKRRDHTIRRSLAAALAEYTKRMHPHQRLFPFKEFHNTAAMMRHDLKRIGVDYQATPTSFRDFHSWRHTFGTEMGKVENIRVVQDMMGHSTPVLTAKYMRPTLADYSAAVEKMPEVGAAKPKHGKAKTA